MRILMLSYEFPPIGGGGARVVHGLSRELVRSGHEVDVVTMGFRGLPRHEEVNGVRVHRIPCLRRQAHVCTAPEAASYVLLALPTVWRLVHRRRFDINHTHFILPDGLLAYAVRCLTGLPYMITAHGSDVPGYNPDRLRVAHRVVAPLWKAVVRHAARMICPSEVLSTLVLNQSKEVKVTLIPNGIDVERFHANGKRPNRLLVVTRMLERKGVQYVLKALERFPCETEVHIVGDGPYLPTLRQMAEQAGIHVKFWGWLDNQAPELKELYESSSIFLLPSEAENCPIVLLEAMAAGTAIITTAGTGCAEVVGETGLLVQPKDPDSIRDALRRLLEQPVLCKELGQMARKRLDERFGWTAITKRYLEEYQQHGIRFNGTHSND